MDLFLNQLNDGPSLVKTRRKSSIKIDNLFDKSGESENKIQNVSTLDPKGKNSQTGISMSQDANPVNTTEVIQPQLEANTVSKEDNKDKKSDNVVSAPLNMQ